jgi:hypothetical protein
VTGPAEYVQRVISDLTLRADNCLSSYSVVRYTY